jgi:uncharacterized protein DUF2808
MNLSSQIEIGKMPFIVILGFAGLALSTAIALSLVPASPGNRPATLSSANVYATNNEVSALSSSYIFAFKTETDSILAAVEITAPDTYNLERAEYDGGTDDVFKFSSFILSGPAMKFNFQQPTHIPAGSVAMIEIKDIKNPSNAGLYIFDIATFDSGGAIVDSGPASILIREPTVSRNSIGTDHIQDGAITTTKIADNSINLNKLAVDAFSFFDERFASIQSALTGQMDKVRTGLEDLIQAEKSARLTADNELQDIISTEASDREAADQKESSTRAAEDNDLRAQIDELRMKMEN